MIPPRVQFFLWLLSKNRLVTRDNLAKRREIRDATFLFCSESETIMHVFFEWCVAGWVWEIISDFLGLSLGQDFESVARYWFV